MKGFLYLCCAATALTLAACNYNNYDRNSPYRGSVDYTHADETVVRQKTKTMTITRDLTTSVGGTVQTRTVTETVTIPEDLSDAEDYKKAQRALDQNNYLEVDINKNIKYQ